MNLRNRSWSICILRFYFLLFTLILVGNEFADAGRFSLSPHVLISPSKKEDKHSLRRVLFGGEPYLSFCADRKNTGLDDFLTKVRKNIGKSTDKVRTALIECDDVVYSANNSKKKKSLRKSLKLKKTQPGEPVVLWSVNGDKPKQLPMNVYTSQVEEDKNKKERGKVKRTSVSVQLDPKKLSEYVLKERLPKIQSITSDENLQKHCFGRKYQLCGILFQSGKMSKIDRKFWLKVANLHRSVRFFTIDTSMHQFSGLSLPELAKTESKTKSNRIRLSVFRRRDYVYSGPNPGSEENKNVIRSLELAKLVIEERNKKLRIPVEVPKLGPRIRISTGLKAVVRSLESETFSDRLVAFRKEEIETSTDFNFEDQKHSIVVLLREGANGYFLNWERAASYLLNKAAFDEVFDEKQLIDLQYKSLSGIPTKSSQKGNDVEYLHFEGNSASGANVSAFLKMSVQPDMPMTSSVVVPSLKKNRKKTLKPRTMSKPSGNPNKKNRYSTEKKKPGSVKKESEKQRIERERKRRLEMDKEALETGAIALGADDTDIDEAEACDEPEEEYLDEYSLDDYEDEDDEDEDENENEDEGENEDEDEDEDEEEEEEEDEEINLDDFEE